MTVRNSPVGAMYDASADLSFAEQEIATIMFTIGLDWSDIETTTIDDIVNAMRVMWPYGEYSDSHEASETYTPAAQDFMSSQLTLLIAVLRRAWFWRHCSAQVV
tara:strand:- start:49 stop:360 length:312 start_codon:yes stop_codon:yes gene_type:complete